MGWVWKCTYDNGAWDWKDSESCRGRSNKKYPDKKSAEKAGAQHKYKTGHMIQVFNTRRLL